MFIGMGFDSGSPHGGHEGRQQSPHPELVNGDQRVHYRRREQPRHCVCIGTKVRHQGEWLNAWRVVKCVRQTCSGGELDPSLWTP